MHHAVREDRLWFQNNPEAIVRFRSAAPGEFMPLEAVGEKPPLFRPSVCHALAPLRWVAVVDLIRLAGSTSPQIMEPPSDCDCAFLPYSAQRRQKPKRNSLIPCRRTA